MPNCRITLKSFLDRETIVLFAMLAAVVAVYSPVLNGQFIWDDGYLVGENPLFRSPAFVWEVFRHYLFVDTLAVYYRPVQNLSYIFDYWLWGDNPFGFHLTNLLLHGGSAFLLFLLLKRILPSLVGPAPSGAAEPSGFVPGCSFCVALVWAVHPIHNAAVAYISGRADSLIACFALSAWLLFIRSETAPPLLRWLMRMSALLSALLALASKEAGLVWMALFLVWLFAFEPNFTRKKKAATLASLLLIVGCYWLLRQLPGPRSSPDTGCEPFLSRLLLMFRALGDYTGLIFWPAKLHMERMLGDVGPYPDLASWVKAIRYDYLSVLGFLSLGMLIWGMIQKGPGQRLRIFGAVWCLIGFLPISNLIPLNAQAAEHWIYLPSIGFLLFLGGLILALPSGHKQIACVVLVATVPLGIRTAHRSADWADQERLLKQTALAGGGTQRIHLNLANVSTLNGALELGERRLRVTLEHFPDYVPARINLGINLLNQKKDAEAEKLLTFDHASAVQAAKGFAHCWSAPLNLARLRFTQGRQAEAVSILDEAMEIHPGIWELVALRAQVLQKYQGPATAIPEVQKYVNARWWHYGASLLLGDLRAANGENQAAAAAWNHAATLDIHSPDPFLHMARHFAAINQLPEALTAQNKAIQREPDHAGNFMMLAAILDQMHRTAESEAAIRKASELRQQALH